MANVVLAACDGCEGNPNDYRDYRLELMKGGRTEQQKDNDYYACSAD